MNHGCCTRKLMGTHRPVNKGAAIVEAGVIVKKLDVSRLQDQLQRQLLRGCQLVEERHRLVVRRSQAGHLREALTQQVVVVAVIHTQVPLQDIGRTSTEASAGLPIRPSEGVLTELKAVLGHHAADCLEGSWSAMLASGHSVCSRQC